MPFEPHQEAGAVVTAVAVAVAAVADAAAAVGFEGAEMAAGAEVKPGHQVYLETIADHCGEH